MKFPVLITLLILCPAPTMAAGGTSFSVKKPQDRLQLAAPFRIEMEASYPAGFSLSPDSNTVSNASFETTDIVAGKPQVSGGQAKQNFTFTVMPFDIGVATFPAVSWLMSGVGASSSTVQSPELPLTINPINSDGKNQEIADIRPPWKPFNWWIVLIIAAIAAVGYALYRRLNREKLHARALAARQDTRPAEVIAFAELEKLLASQVWEDGKFKQFYNSLADILRDYLTRRTGVPAANYNTTELCREMDRNGGDRILVASTRKFLQQCDLVKFAKYIPTGEEKNDCVELLRLIVRQSTPVPQTPATVVRTEARAATTPTGVKK
jgi:hypothetical protein